MSLGMLTEQSVKVKVEKYRLVHVRKREVIRGWGR